eukprot:scaffold3.g6539.t1
MCGGWGPSGPDGLTECGRSSLDLLTARLRESLRKCKSHGDMRLEYLSEACGDADAPAAKLVRISSVDELGSFACFTEDAIAVLSQSEALDRSSTDSPNSVEPPDAPPSPSAVVRSAPDDGGAGFCGVLPAPRALRVTVGRGGAEAACGASPTVAAASPCFACAGAPPLDNAVGTALAVTSSLFSSSCTQLRRPADYEGLPFTESAAPVAAPSGGAGAPPCPSCSGGAGGAGACSAGSSSCLTSAFAPPAGSPFGRGGSPPPPLRAHAESGGALGLPGGSRSGSPAAQCLEREASCPPVLDFSRRCSAEASGGVHEGHAAQELFYRLNHARQTLEFVRRQATAFSALDKAELDVWGALELLNDLREYEAVLLGPDDADPELPLLDHALQSAEACRLAFPGEEWMALAGLLHGLGKLLAHARLGGEPQWAICGESFPVGCRFHPAVVHSQLFAANPDRRKRAYSTPTGVYREGCGLSRVCMSWSGAEYLFLVLCLNRTLLPPEALFCLRHQRFRAVLRAGAPYSELLSPWDRAQLPRLARFQELVAYRRRPPAEGQLRGQALRDHYAALLDKYIPQRALRW